MDTRQDLPRRNRTRKKPPPYNFNGCWDGSSIVGSLEDENYGTGYGWIWIIQSGKNMKGGKNKNER